MSKEIITYLPSCWIKPVEYSGFGYPLPSLSLTNLRLKPSFFSRKQLKWELQYWNHLLRAYARDADEWCCLQAAPHCWATGHWLPGPARPHEITWGRGMQWSGHVAPSLSSYDCDPVEYVKLWTETTRHETIKRCQQISALTWVVLVSRLKLICFSFFSNQLFLWSGA